MSEIAVIGGWLALVTGTFFFLAGALGLARFPDIHCRLHAVTKADTLGMGLLVIGLTLHNPDWNTAAIMLLVWLLVAASSAVTCHLLARYEQRDACPEDSR